MVVSINIENFSCSAITTTEHMTYPGAYIAANKALEAAKQVTCDLNDFHYYFAIIDKNKGQLIHYKNIDLKKSKLHLNLLVCDSFESFGFTF